MPRIITNVLWSPEEIEAMKHGQVVETIVNGQQIFHQAERPRKQYTRQAEVVDQTGQPLQLAEPSAYKKAWTPERKRRQAEIMRQRNLRMKRQYSTPHNKGKRLTPEQRAKVSEGMKRWHANRRKEQQPA